MSAKQVQIRRDTATNLATVTPAIGELGMDVTNKRLVLGDGATAGGIKHASAKDVQNSTFTYGTVGGTANAITLTHSAPVLSYAAGQKFIFKAVNTNTGAATINIDGCGIRNILRLSNGSLVPLTGGEIPTGAISTIVFDGTQFQLTSAVGGFSAIRQQVFTTSGTYSPSVGMLYCIIEAIGGGGAGMGNGGGSGEYVRSVKPVADIGSSQAVTIGGGGTGSAGNDNGGDTSFGSLVIAKGGIGTSSGGGDGGTGGTGDFKIAGGSGWSFGAGWCGGDSFFGYGGRSGSSPKATSGYGGGGAGSSPGASGVIVVTEYCSM